MHPEETQGVFLFQITKKIFIGISLVTYCIIITEVYKFVTNTFSRYGILPKCVNIRNQYFQKR